MKNRIIVLLIALFVLSTVSVAANGITDRLVVAGTIYAADDVTEVPYADVHIECEGVVVDTVSGADGDYAAEFWAPCAVGSTAYVTATKDGSSGSASDTVEDYTYIQLAIVNVSIPEFGTVTAGIALFGAAAVYFFRRKK